MAHPAAVKYLQRLGITAVELLPVHQFVQDATLLAEGAAKLLGLQLDRLPGAAQRILAQPAGRAGSGIQAARQDPARRRHRGHPGCRLQPYGGGQPSRADAVVQGHRQRRVLPPHERQAAVLHGLHGHGQHAEHAASARAAAHHGQPAVLGARDARGRVPVRSRGNACARAPRRRPPVGVLRSHSAGSGRQPGQADCRAVGHRRRRIPGRQLPTALVGMEREVPRHRPRLLAGHGSDDGGVRVSVHRQLRLCIRGPPGSRTRASTSSPRTTASRSAISCPTTRSTTRPTARTIATGRITTVRGTAARKGRQTIPRSTRCAHGRCAISSRRCCSRRASRCCSAATRSVARSAATTTRTARTTRSRGTTGRRPTRPCCSSRGRCCGFDSGIRCSAGAGGSRAGRSTAPA